MVLLWYSFVMSLAIVMVWLLLWYDYGNGYCNGYGNSYSDKGYWSSKITDTMPDTREYKSRPSGRSRRLCRGRRHTSIARATYVPWLELQPYYSECQQQDWTTVGVDGRCGYLCQMIYVHMDAGGARPLVALDRSRTLVYDGMDHSEVVAGV